MDDSHRQVRHEGDGEHLDDPSKLTCFFFLRKVDGHLLRFAMERPSAFDLPFWCARSATKETSSPRQPLLQCVQMCSGVSANG